MGQLHPIVVVNGDDFGVNHATNLAVARAFRQGVLTSASVIAPAPWFDEAVELARRYGIPLGVHLTLTCEYSLYRFGPLTRSKGLSVDGKGWVFPSSANDIDAAQVGAVVEEVLAQVERVFKADIRPTHIDAHMGAVPRWDGAFSEALRAVWREFKVPFVTHKAKRPEGLPPEAIVPVDGFESISADIPFAAKKARMLEILRKLQGGVFWMACHPCEDLYEPDAAGAPPGWGASLRSTDLQVLCDRDVSRLAEGLGIRFVSASEVVELSRCAASS